MKTCQQTQTHFVEGLYGDLDEAGQAAFEKHLGACARCAAEFEALRATLDVMDRREVEEPHPDFWDDFSERVLEQTASANRQPSGNILEPQSWPVPEKTGDGRGGIIPEWALRAAAAVAILAIGITIGRLTLDSPVGVPATGGRAVVATADSAALNQRVNQYMERSRTLLLGIVNLDPAADGFEALDLAPYQRVSHQLVEEAPLLERDLSGAGERRLARLVLELEEILMQISSLETGGAIEGVQVVRDGVDQRALLFKIHLESTRQTTPPANPKKDNNNHKPQGQI